MLKQLTQLKRSIQSKPLTQLKDDNNDNILNTTSLSDKENNHIYFYTDVDNDTCLDLNKKINELNKELLKYSIEYEIPPPNIYLHINSFGGNLFSAFSTIDTIINSRVPIISIIEGAAASAATIISMVCHKRYITPNSFMLIHQLSSGIEGKYEEIKEDFINDTTLMDLLYKLYLEHTTMNIKTIKKVLKHDLWWNAEKCIENGLVDDIYKNNTINVSLNSHFSNIKFDSNNITNLKKIGNRNSDIIVLNELKTISSSKRKRIDKILDENDDMNDDDMDDDKQKDKQKDRKKIKIEKR